MGNIPVLANMSDCHSPCLTSYLVVIKIYQESRLKLPFSPDGIQSIAKFFFNPASDHLTDAHSIEVIYFAHFEKIIFI